MSTRNLSLALLFKKLVFSQSITWKIFSNQDMDPGHLRCFLATCGPPVSATYDSIKTVKCDLWTIEWGQAEVKEAVETALAAAAHSYFGYMVKEFKL